MTTVSFLVIPTLVEPDVILGMDLLQRLGVKIDTKAGVAEPTVLVSCAQPLETWQIPARKLVVFQIRNPFSGQQRDVLFEPSEKLPAVIRGTTSLGQGERVYVQLENTSEEEQILNPDWEIGTVKVVEEEPDYPRVEIEEAGLPPVPEGITPKRRAKGKFHYPTAGLFSASLKMKIKIFFRLEIVRNYVKKRVYKLHLAFGG